MAMGPCHLSLASLALSRFGSAHSKLIRSVGIPAALARLSQSLAACSTGSPDRRPGGVTVQPRPRRRSGSDLSLRCNAESAYPKRITAPGTPNCSLSRMTRHGTYLMCSPYDETPSHSSQRECRAWRSRPDLTDLSCPVIKARRPR